jgi:hypothetical protein
MLTARATLAAVAGEEMPGRLFVRNVNDGKTLIQGAARRAAPLGRVMRRPTRNAAAAPDELAAHLFGDALGSPQ